VQKNYLLKKNLQKFTSLLARSREIVRDSRVICRMYISSRASPEKVNVWEHVQIADDNDVIIISYVLSCGEIANGGE